MQAPAISQSKSATHAPPPPDAAARTGSPAGLWAAAAVIALANLAVLAAQAPALARNLYLNADNASALVLPALSGHAPPGSVVNIGDHPWYEPWWYMRATVGLPGYHQLWEIAPIVLGLLGIVAVTACAWRALGALAALLCGATLVAASEGLRIALYAPEVHGLVVLHLGVMCGALLIVLEWARSGRLTPARLLLLGVPFVIFTGAGLTDQLLLVSGLGPFVLAPALCWLRLRSRVWLAVAAFALATVVLSGLLALELTHVMQEEHVVHAPFPISFVGAGAIVSGLENALDAFLAIAGGPFLGAPASGTHFLTLLAGVLVLIALALVLRVLWRWAAELAASVTTPTVSRSGRRAERSMERPPHESGPVSGDGPTADISPDTGGATRELFTAFWGLVLVCVFAAFTLTQLSGEAGNARYLVGAWVALAALLGLLAKSAPARTALLIGVAAFGALNLRAELATGVPPSGPGPNLRIAGEIEHFAAAHGASVGYTGYWDGAPVTWETHLRVQLIPIEACTAPTGWCAFFNNQISSWYIPRPHTRTFLLTDERPGIPAAVPAPPAAFGRPIAGESLGEGFTIFVYNGDIASHLGP